jgi:hypothetical protein
MSVNWSVPTASSPQDRIGAFMGQRRWLKFALYIAGWTVAAFVFAVSITLDMAPRQWPSDGAG